MASQSVLGCIALGYGPLWGRSRQLIGVRLFVEAASATPVDARHLLPALGQFWSDRLPPLLLVPQTPALLSELLDWSPVGAPALEVPHEWLADTALATRVQRAAQRGLRVVWRGELAQAPQGAEARLFARQVLRLSVDEALAALRASMQRRPGASTYVGELSDSPVRPEQVYEGVASRALADHCLDQQQAYALADWPVEDVLHGYRYRAVQPSRRAITRLVKSIETDQSMEMIEQALGEEPVLAYRFLTYVNSAGSGLRDGVETLRHGLMMMGLGTLSRWLVAQLPHANEDMDLVPVRTEMVLCGRLMEYLTEAGIENDLRREVYLCGLLSQINVLLGEPQEVALRRVSLSERIQLATLKDEGPYAPYLAIARALTTSDTAATRRLCEEHSQDIEDVNRALLRTLSGVPAEP